MKKSRIIFTDDFYRLCAVVLSTKFKRLEKQIQDKYLALGYPIPTNGFSTYGEYKNWLDKTIKLVDEDNTPGRIVDEVLKQFKLDIRDEDNRYVITNKLFLGKYPWQINEYTHSPIKLVVKGEGNDKQVWVKIEPWTKKSDYDNLWDSIENMLKNLPGYRGKEKFQPTFKRDFEAYQLYLKTKREGSKQVLKAMSSCPEYYSIAEQFKEGDVGDQLRSIKSRFNKLLAGIDIL